MLTRHLKQIKNSSSLAAVLLLVLVTSCATTGDSGSQAEVIHLTSPDTDTRSQQATISNPQQAENATISTVDIDPQEPILQVNTADGLPPDTPAIISLPSEGEEPQAQAQSHRVVTGDTLYSIAKRYDKDYETLAITNSLDAHYTIYLGQVLNLDTSTTLVSSESAIATPPPAAKAPPTQAPAPKPPKKITAKPKKNTPKIYTDRKVNREAGLLWTWPILKKPKVLRAFSKSNGESIKGIDIAGEEGAPVIATGDGIVVYAGNELSGYGNLVIISHGERYISAYAHNKKILVKEEQKVKQGQEIGLIGSTGTDQTKLFFQIRKDSQPVDPIIYLPKR